MEQYNSEYDYGDSPIYMGDDHLMPQQTVQNAMQVNMIGYQQLSRVPVSNPQVVFTPVHHQIITPGLSSLPVMGTMANIVHMQQPQQIIQQHQIQGYAQPVFQQAQTVPIMQTTNVSMLPAGTSLIPIHQNGQMMSGNTQIDQIMAETKEPIKSKPKAAKKTSKSTNSGLSSMQIAIQSQGSQYKELRDFVARILERQTNHGYAAEFTERALLNLAKKVTAIQLTMLNDWENAINTGDPSIGCVVVPRPKDGRMTVTKTYGGHNTKKVFPQILVCQIFRWPQIVFRHDIRSVESCQHKSIIKSANSSFNSEDVQMDDLECSNGGDVICINPFHFYLTNEAKARIQKSQNKAMKSQSQQQQQQVECLQQQEPIPNVFFHQQQQLAQTAEQHLPQVQEQTFSQIQNFDIHEQTSMSSSITLDPDPESSGDESESSDEVVSVNSDDTVDYVKMWQDQAEHPDYGATMTKNLTVDDVLGELKLYKYKEESKQLDELSPDTFSKLKIRESILNSILSGKLARKAMRRANIKLEDEDTSDEEEEDDVCALNQSGFDGTPSLFEFDDLEESTHVPMEKVLKKGPPFSNHRLHQDRGLLMAHRNEMARLDSDAMQHVAGPSHNNRDFLKRDTVLDSFSPQSFTAQVIPGSSLLLNSASSKQSQFSHVTGRDDDNSLDNLLASIQGSYHDQYVTEQSTSSGVFFDPDDNDDDLPVAVLSNIVGNLGDEVFDPMVDF